MPSDERDPTDSLERRVASLESVVRALTDELARLRSDRRGLSDPESGAPVEHPTGRPSASPHPMAPRSPLAVAPEERTWLPAQLDVESLVGRYGTLLLATISALAAVGMFLNWAIAKGYLGPSQRIALGLITAAALGVAGLRLHGRERSFGASLLGLALAITHVCAWGAGPLLKLIPPWGAFVLAALASIALAVFAHAEDDEPLWSVGFSGAAIAPFVTASGRSNLLLLAAYGVAVLASAGYAMGARRWVVAGRLFLLAAMMYTLALATGHEIDFGPPLAMAFPLAVALTGVVPWIGGWPRRERLRALGALTALAALRTGMGIGHPLDETTVASLIAAAGIVWLVLVDRTHAVAEPVPSPYRHLHEGDWLDAAVLPLAFTAATVAALDASAHGSGLAMAAAAAILLVSMMRYPQGSLRDAAVFATVISALVAVLLLLKGRESELLATIAVLSAAGFAANLKWRSISWTTLGLIGLAWAVLASLAQLSTRTPYEYAPFLTEESAVAAVVLASILTAMRLTPADAKLDTVLRGAAMAWAFLWVHQELALAVNPTVGMLLRVTYYAATSVTAVALGRARQVPVLRHVGLGLAVVAAGTALYGARNLESIGARIGADLVAAVFLLAIAYWYRRPGSGRMPRAATAPQSQL